MKKNVYVIIVLAFLFTACATKDKYDINRYYNRREQQEVLASIINFIYAAPPYTLMKDRFKPEHRAFYVSQTSKFSIRKFYKNKGGTCFFLVDRPAFKFGGKRAVGGFFKMNEHHQLMGFREMFVTPILPENEVKIRGEFLFDEMVKGELEKYLRMQSYVQWPNEASFYDTLTYEWKMKEAL